MCGGPMISSKSQKASEDKYRAEDDARTLTRAEEIRGDKGRLARVHGHLREQMTSIGKVAGSIDGKKSKSKRRGRKRAGGRR